MFRSKFQCRLSNVSCCLIFFYQLLCFTLGALPLETIVPWDCGILIVNVCYSYLLFSTFLNSFFELFTNCVKISWGSFKLVLIKTKNGRQLKKNFNKENEVKSVLGDNETRILVSELSEENMQERLESCTNRRLIWNKVSLF